MISLIKKSKAQSTIEYAIMIVALIAALVAMKGLIQKSIQGKVKSSADQTGQQFEPGKATRGYVSQAVAGSHETVTREVSGTIDTHAGGEAISLTGGKATIVDQSETMETAQEETWSK